MSDTKVFKTKIRQKLITSTSEENTYLASITPAKGDSYINTASGKAVLKVYDGSKWVDNEVDLSDKLDANGLSTEEQSNWGYWSQNQSSSLQTTKIKRNSKTILNLNTEDNVTGYSNESGWHITPNVINSSQSFSETDANVYLKSTSTDGVVGVTTQKNLPENEVFMKATFEGDGVHFTSGGAGQAATLDITRDSVKRNDKTETWENILNAPSKIDSKADAEDVATISNDMTLVKASINTLSSDKADKTALDGKLDKLTTGGVQKVYAHTGKTQNEINVSTSGDTANTIPIRDSYYRISIGDPNGNKTIDYAANKTFVNDTVNSAVKDKVYEANLQRGGKNFKDNYSPVDAAMMGMFGADRFKAISKADAITVEYSRDGGTTWTDFGLTDERKLQLFSDISGDPSPRINIGKATTGTEITTDYKLRITIDTYATGLYCSLNKFLLDVSTDGSRDCTCTIESAQSQDTTGNFDIVHAQDVPIAGWSGVNVINVSSYDFGYPSSSANRRGKIRFTFSIGSHTETAHTGLQIRSIKAFGGVGWSTPSNEAHYRSPFRYDGSKYIADRPFNFTSDVQAAGKQLATQEYVDSKSSSVTVVDNLTSTSTTSVLSANQGKVLNDKLDLKYDLASGVGLNDYDVSVISENGDLMSDVYAGDISVTQVNGSSGLSGGIKIDNSVPTLYSGSKSETIENVIDSVIASGLTDEIAKNYNIVSSKNWTKTSSGGGMLGEAQYNKYYPLVYNQPVNEEVIKLAKIINAETNAVLATFTSVEELDSNTHTTAYHFGDNFTIIVIHEQEGDYTQLYDGRIPPYSWVNGFSYGVYLCGALLNTSGEYWYAENIPNTANLRIEFPTPLVAPKGSRTAIGGTYFTREKYIFYDDGRRECEILACAENVAITSSWGSLYEGSLGSFSFLTGFFTTEPEMSVEMCNTLNSEESGGVACFIETGVKPSTTSTGVLYAVRPNGSGVGKRIYFKIHARQV